MAPPPTSRPARLLILLTAFVIGLAAWAFWPGTDHTIRLGLDLQGGTQVILQPRPVTEGESVTEEQLQQTVTIIRQRVDGLGVSEAEVTTQGSGDGAALAHATTEGGETDGERHGEAVDRALGGAGLGRGERERGGQEDGQEGGELGNVAGHDSSSRLTV